jgi:hypothetical protein
VSESGAFVAGGGGFVRVRDNAGGFSAEYRRQRQVEEERRLKAQAEQELVAHKREEERQKQAVQNQVTIAECSREYYARDTQSWMRVGIIDRYSRARGISYEQGAAELNSLEMVQRVDPQRYAKYQQRQKGKPIAESLADLKADYDWVSKCKFCRTQYFTAEELTAHYRDTKPCPHRSGVCRRGGEVHVCTKYDGSIIEDRLPIREEERLMEDYVYME